MKANELMIGDWVYDTLSQTNIKVNRPCFETNPLNGICYAENLVPIPLTPEILEKNGFEKVYDKYKLPNYRIKWNSYTDLYFTVFTGVDGYWNPTGLNVITGGIPATVDYVHQLQHALKLCGIEKTIIL